jgi:hypothetical protein
MSMLNNIVGYTGLIFRGLYILGGRGNLYLGVYIWNEVSVIIAVIFRESEVYSIQLKKAVFSCHRHTFLGAYRTAYTLGSQVDPMEI